MENGGLMVHEENGVEVWIEPAPERQCLAVLGKTVYDFWYHPEPLPGEDPSDRIRMIITSADGGVTEALGNVEDALLIIRGLSICATEAVVAGVPTRPKEAYELEDAS